MGAMRTSAWLRRSTHRLSALLVVLTLAGAVVVHHSQPPGAMGGMHGEHAMAATAMCAGTVACASAIVGLIAATLTTRRKHQTRPVAQPVVVRLAPTAPLPRARSSPLYLRYAVLRR